MVTELKIYDFCEASATFQDTHQMLRLPRYLHVCHVVARPCHCDSSKSPRHMLRLPRHREKGHITKCCACHEKTTRLLWHASKVLRLSRKTRKRPPSLWLGSAKKCISCETSSTFHTLKERIVSQCVCTAQWREINELTTSWRRVEEATNATRTQVQPQTPTINGNPSLRIRETGKSHSSLRNNWTTLTGVFHICQNMSKHQTCFLRWILHRHSKHLTKQFQPALFSISKNHGTNANLPAKTEQ